MKFYMLLVVIILFVVIFITQDSLGAPSNKTYDESFEISDSGEKYYLAEEPPNVEKNSSEEYHLAKETFDASSREKSEPPNVEKKLNELITEEESFEISDSDEKYYLAEEPPNLDKNSSEEYHLARETFGASSSEKNGKSFEISDSNENYYFALDNSLETESCEY
ncbi:uncharacterized protein LOC126902544 isoform X1 [Daktulosphaira vitifoliae]|uniref:uncharacterized protein LOC126902544 isoform X1 n=1 Tax=Daktulosphaira vitifoliae TaxID=58002 RepID=UPI0021AB0847|nr:uncharacterized protein LOC126902544 isoform X1 [Daktulosphaira vitifoliae]